MQGDSANKGFTLIVLIVTVSIASVLALVAVPSFTQFIDESRDRAVVYKLIKSLVAARSEAVVRAGPVSLSAIDDNWANSWLSWVDTDGNGSYGDGKPFWCDSSQSGIY
jgi:type IV fimbrial biogenesis protein FimT